MVRLCRRLSKYGPAGYPDGALGIGVGSYSTGFMVAKKKTVQTKSGQNQAEVNETTFEESLASLEGIVAKLESGELGLGESLDAYEQGIGQLKKCHQLLAAAERRVEILSGLDADGNPILESFREPRVDRENSEKPDDQASSEELF